MTSKELDERINDIHIGWALKGNENVKQLIRDCIEAVTPERSTSPGWDWDNAIDDIEANTKELLG